MKKPEILVVGSFVMDQIVTTDVFPRQGQSVIAKTLRKAPGGKGANQAVQMARLGANVTMCGKLGLDDNGKEMLRVCQDAGICTEHICFDPEAASGCAVVILEKAPDTSAKNRIMVIPGANMTLESEDVAFLEEDIARYDLVVLQLEIPLHINTLIARYAHAKGVPVMLNSAPSAALPQELLECLTYISPNEHEATDLTGIEIQHDGDEIDLLSVQRAAKCLQDKGAGNVLITLGAAGAALAQGDRFIVSPAVKDVRAVDPTAAGDSFIGAFCTAVCLGVPTEEALRFANFTAALTVTRMGAMPSLPTLDEVLKTMPGALAQNMREAF